MDNLQVHADQKQLWLHEIWRDIHAMMHSDGYFKLWLNAQEIAPIPYGPIAQTIINGYTTFQLAAVRRICDRAGARRCDIAAKTPRTY